jgi:hypothetical protein
LRFAELPKPSWVEAKILLFCVCGAMPIAQDLIERARMFEKRAEQARDPISRRHYKEMAAHYRALSVEHQEIKPEHESAH